MNYKAKPCFNFQSIEFEMEVNNKDDWAKFISIYNRCYKALKAIAPETEKKAQKKPAPDPVTDSQLEIMQKHGIEVPDNCTRKQAAKLIEDSIKRAKEEADLDLDDDDDMPF